MNTSSVKDLRLLKENVRALLLLRKEDQVSLAQWVGHSKAWINKFLNEEEAEIQLKDLDRIADFLGVVAYQLFQPGISARAERRMAGDRRIGRDRRIGHQGRQLAGLRTELNKLPSVASSHGSTLATRPPALPDPIQRIILTAARDIDAFYARKQAPTAGDGQAGVPKDHRKVRRSAGGK